MARQLRIEYEGAIYHVTCRMLGDARSRLFRDDKARWRFLDQLAERVDRFNIRLYMFVLMSNHIHLVFETPTANCSEFMQSLLTAYTVYYNIRHRRHGHLFDGRYKAKLVDGDAASGDYLLTLSRYVHLNPVRVGRLKEAELDEKVRALRSYRWSSYPGYIGKRKELTFVEYGPVLAQMNVAERERRRRYRVFVEGGMAEDDTEFRQVLKESRLGIGGEVFRSRTEEVYQKLVSSHKRAEDVAFRRTTMPLPAERTLEVVGGVLGVEVAEFRRRRRDSSLRAVASHFLVKYSTLSQREVAACLHVASGTAIGKQLSRFDRLIQDDRQLARLCRKAQHALDNERSRQSGAKC